jgi:formylglycine-generating enzyme
MKRIIITTIFAVAVSILLSNCPATKESPGNSTNETVVIPDIKQNFVEVAGDSFTVGSDATDDKSYNPAHTVTVSSFYISKYETTFNEYDAYTKSTGQSLKPDTYNIGRGQKPAYCISWYEAVEYANWRSGIDGLTPVYTIDKVKKDADNTSDDTGDYADTRKWTVTANWSANGYRLPTEAEWEFAAKGGKLTQNYKYSGSNDLPEVAWFGGKKPTQNNATATKKGDSHDVGTKKANELGIYDLTGNVGEWIWDKANEASYDKGYTEILSQTTNPTGITGKYGYRIFRGGTSNCPMLGCLRTTNRFIKGSYVDGSSPPIGIRLVKNH